MFTGEVIYILEIALCVLSASLFLLIGMKYREYLRSEERLAALIAKREVKASKHSKPKNTLPSPAAFRMLSDVANMRAKTVAETDLPLMDVEDSEDIQAQLEEACDSPTGQPSFVANLPESRALDDLNDYIGGFFSAPSSLSPDLTASQYNASPQDLPVAANVLQNELVSTGSSDADDEDSFIVVEEDSSSDLKGKSRIMSDRVVRSMLDEASIA